MYHKPEPILNSSALPGKLYLYKLVNISRHRHTSIEINFVLSGTVKVYIDNQMYTLIPTDLIVFNSMSMHELYSTNAEILSLEIDLSESEYFNAYKNCIFNCCTANDTFNPKYNQLRHLLAKLVKESSNTHCTLNALSATAALIHELVTNHQIFEETTAAPKKKNEKFFQIIDYIHNNYAEDITLNSLAKHFHFSQPALSRLFVNHMGVSFTDYYNNVRLDHATQELVAGTDSIANVAIKSGFSNTRSMTALFKKVYQVLPSEYRKKHAQFIPEKKAINDVNYLTVNTSQSLSTLAQFLEPESNNTHSTSSNMTIDIGAINVAQKGTELKHTWRNICCIGSVRELFYEDVRNMLRKVQSEFPFKYIVFHGITSDDLLMYDESPNGNIVINFFMLDQALDFLKSIHLKPFFQISFMPKALARDLQKTNYFIGYNSSLPKDLEKWNYLISELIKHCIDRYSLEEILTWPICLWNEPDTTPQILGFENKEEFFPFYASTYKTVKSIDPRLSFGTPALLFLPEDQLDWYHPFFEYCKNNNCMPDFFNVHFYDDDILLVSESPYFNVINRITPDKDAFTKYLDDMFVRMKEYGIENIPVYMTEWNLTINQRNLINDTCFKSCYITKNLLENYDRTSALSYWSMTDMVHELQPASSLFHGGLGMFTRNGIPKAHYYAFWLISKLGNEKVNSGKGWFLTRNTAQNSYQLIVYNYTHFGQLFSSGELFDMTLTNRYTSFPDLRCCDITITLNNIDATHCRMQEIFINKNNGSSYDTWVKMGGIELNQQNELDSLYHNSYPGYKISEFDITDHTLTYKQTLKPLEVRFIEFRLS